MLVQKYVTRFLGSNMTRWRVNKIHNKLFDQPYHYKCSYYKHRRLVHLELNSSACFIGLDNNVKKQYKAMFESNDGGDIRGNVVGPKELYKNLRNK